MKQKLLPCETIGINIKQFFILYIFILYVSFMYPLKKIACSSLKNYVRVLKYETKTPTMQNHWHNYLKFFILYEKDTLRK